MKRIIAVGGQCVISKGALKGKIATIIAYDLLKDEVKLVIDTNYTIITKSINIRDDYVDKLENALMDIRADLRSIDGPTDFDSYIDSDLKIINRVLEGK